MSRKKKRPTSNYLSTAKQLNKFISSLRKYSRRKTLSRWEKAAITRATKRLKHEGGTANLFPLTKSQVKRIKDKSVIINRGGIKAVRFRNMPDGTKIVVRKGKIELLSGDRRFINVRLQPDILVFLEAGRKIFRKNKDKDVTIFTWTFSGRSKRGFADIESFVRNIQLAFNEYNHPAAEFMLGLQYYAE